MKNNSFDANPPRLPLVTTAFVRRLINSYRCDRDLAILTSIDVEISLELDFDAILLELYREPKAITQQIHYLEVLVNHRLSLTAKVPTSSEKKLQKQIELEILRIFNFCE